MLTPIFKLKTKKQTDTQGTFIIEPLQPGFGHTVGNALRRVLLTSLPGAAITFVKIKGVRHRFSTLEGMKEDIVEFILNLKQVRLKYDGEKPVKLKLSATGPKTVTAGDITAPASVTIVNPDLPLAHLADKKTKLEAELTVESGMGYSLFSERSSRTVGVIPIDAVFNPVLHVNYTVEATRVGRRTDFDRVVLEVTTDGTIKPKDAVLHAAQILVGFFQQIYQPKPVKLEEEPKKLVSEPEVLKLTVEELDLPTRIANALRKGGFKTVKDLANATPSQIAQVKNIGKKSVDTVIKKLQAKGIKLKEE